MSNSSSTPPFALGAYLGNPNGSDASAEATFEADYNSFTATLGAAPTYLTNYVDYAKSISDWVSNASWQAWSDAQSVDAKDMIPVVGLPMASIASDAGTSDSQYQAIAAGDYDSVYKGILQSYVANGYTNLVFRPGWEMNINGPTYAGDTAQDQADWVAAFQRVYTVLHQEAATLGVNVTVVWNPSATNYTNAEALTGLYPGNAYVDAIGADVYSDIYPYSDGTNSSGQQTYHDWDTGKEDTSVAQFIADPVNRAHYWTYPAATKWSNDGSGGHALSLDQIIAFAEAQGKPLAIPETGAGNSDAGTDVSDDAAFPQWLAQQLTAAEAQGEKVDFVNIWDSNGGGNYEFSNSSDGKPLEAAAWGKYFGAQATAANDTVACYTTGTLILTTRGEVPVEGLAIGDRVITAGGAVEPVRWIGRRSYAGRALAANPGVQPILLRAGSLGDGLPRRDLRVSPEHAMFLDGVLVPARCLVNGTTIVQDRACGRVDYFHVELDRHSVILAEAAPSESFVDDDNRSMFQNAHEWQARYPGRPRIPAVYCAPRVESGAALTAIRRRLDGAGVQEIVIRGGVTHEPIRSGTIAVRLVSESGHVGCDRRRLGVAVTSLTLDGERLALDDARLGTGWHAAENEGHRWTNGGALVLVEGSRTIGVAASAPELAVAA